MAGWSWDDIYRRNLEVFGAVRPAVSPAAPEKLAEDLSEATIEAECCKLLAGDGWRILKTNPVSDRRRGKGFGELGMADTLAVRYGRQGAACEVLRIEWKARGGRVRKHQAAWHARERARGAMTAIAEADFSPSVEGFAGWYRASGLARGW
jgi:hypothetical protein